MLTIKKLMLNITITTGLWCVLCSLSILADASSGPVWKVSKGQQSLFVGGTIHVLSPSDYPLPSVFDQAYQQADVLVFEADVAQMQTAEAQSLVIEKTTYSDGSTLKQALSAETYAVLTQFLSERGGDVSSLDQFKPGILTILLTLNELQRLGQSGQGVDAFYDQQAIADKKPRMFLETIEQQLDFLGSMGEGQEDSLVLHTLDELQDLSSAMLQLKSAWKKGDNEALMAVALIPWMADFPDIYQTLLVQRNNAWLPQIEAMLVTPAVEYVLVGALHLAGKDGILEQLRGRGYQVEQL
ncbi:MAG: hypothetical protein ACI9D5_000226 [Candidatus Endobugula sp.]|jgi:uncharacterized protein YbaP (TraB family)